MITVWRYGGGEYPFSVCAEECMNRLREGLARMKAADVDERESQAEAYCRMIEGFFDAVLGDGVGAAVCGGDEDGCSDAYLSFTEYVSAQLDCIKEARQLAEERYLTRLDNLAERNHGSAE